MKLTLAGKGTAFPHIGPPAFGRPTANGLLCATEKPIKAMTEEEREQAEKQRIAECKYYTGQAGCPYGDCARATTWRGEELYVQRGYIEHSVQGLLKHYKIYGGKPYTQEQIPEAILAYTFRCWEKWCYDPAQYIDDFHQIIDVAYLSYAPQNAITRDELLTHCSYYEGGENNPYKSDDENFFWDMERMYLDAAYERHDWCGLWEAHAEKTMEELQGIDCLYTDPNISIHTKGIARYIEEMSADEMPRERNKIFNYRPR